MRAKAPSPSPRRISENPRPSSIAAPIRRATSAVLSHVWVSRSSVM
jgi:hypothetical protein